MTVDPRAEGEPPMTEPLRPDADPAAETSVTPVPATTHSTATPATPITAAQPVAPATPVATDPVVPPPATTPVTPRSRGRWIGAIAVIALVIGASAAVAFALTSSSAQATVTGYVPADSVMYGEIRLDLPGDQRAEVAEFLAKFPGFADQAALETKLDEVLDRLIGEATEGEQTFSTDIKPWFDGEVAVAAGPISMGGSADAKAPEGLVLLSIKDAAVASAWFDEVLDDITATPPATESYGGTDILVYTEPNSGESAAFAIIDGKVAVAGDEASVKAAIDTNGDSGFADDPDVAAAANAMDGDSIAFMYVALGDIVDAATSALDGMAPEFAALPMTELVPDWAAFRLRVEGDALVMDGAMPAVEEAPGPDTNHANGVAAWAPPTTIALAAGNDAGASIDEVLDQYRADSSVKDALDELEQAAGILGGLDGIVGWMGDTGVIVVPEGEMPSGGLISVPTDAQAASQLFTSLRSFAALAGGQLGITVSDEDYAGTTVTTVDLGSLEELAGMAGSLSGEELPVEPGAIPSDEHVTIAFAATDQVVVIGSSPAFVKAVLDAGPGPSLADDSRFQATVGRVGAEHTGLSYVDVAAMRTLIESHLDEASAEERAEYEESVKPFLTPFDAFAAATVVGGDVNEHHAVITVK
jgi:hypothetical protein